MRVAVVDLGTNSTRLLVADADGDRVETVERRTTVTRLGEGVDASGRLADAAQERVFAAVGEFRAVMDELGAERVVAVATSAVRDSANGDEFRAALRERFDVDARTISGDEEARLTFLGATAPRAGTGRTLVIDIGGGSTELVCGEPARPPEFHVSTRAGSVRQTERHLHDDPPAPDQVTALATEVGGIFAAVVPEAVRAGVERGIAVAGTATQLAAIDQELPDPTPDQIDGHELPLAAAERILAMLAALPLERRRGVTGLHPDRAPTIVAGAAILVQAILAFGLESVEVSETDILQGAALEAAAQS